MNERGVAPVLVMAAVSGLAFGVVAGLAFLKSQPTIMAQSEEATQPDPDAATDTRNAQINMPLQDASVAPLQDSGAVRDAKEHAPEDAQPRRKAFATLRFRVVPAHANAKVRVNGKAVDGDAASVDLGAGPRSIRILVSAKGYRPYRSKVQVDGDRSLTIDISQNLRRTFEKNERIQKDARSTPVKEDPKGPGGLLEL